MGWKWKAEMNLLCKAGRHTKNGRKLSLSPPMGEGRGGAGVRASLDLLWRIPQLLEYGQNHHLGTGSVLSDRRHGRGAGAAAATAIERGVDARSQGSSGPRQPRRYHRLRRC